MMESDEEEETLKLHVRIVEGHTCALNKDEDVLVTYISGGIWVDFRRKVKRFMMISATNPESKAALKSTAQIRQEEYEHLSRHYYMIHPFSRFRVYWETFMIPVYTILLLVIPIEICTKNTDNIVLYGKLIADFASYIDIVLWFCTGYYDYERQRTVMAYKNIWRHYVKGWFFIDFTSSLPFNLYIIKFHHTKILPKLPYIWTIKLIMALKLFRLKTLLEYLKKFFERLSYWSNAVKLANFALCYFIVIWWATSIVFIFKNEEHLIKNNSNIAEELLHCGHQIIMSFMLVGIGRVATHKFLHVIFNAFRLLFGTVVTMIILAQVMQIYNRHTNSSNKYIGLLKQMDEYMKYKELPPRLKDRVFHCVDFKFQKRVYKETDILQTLSSNLQQEILLHNCKRLVEKVDFFKSLPTPLIMRIVTKLKSETYLPNDIIVQAGIAGNSMYFIYMGTVAVYTSTGKEICHLNDGAHFGEIAMMIQQRPIASVVAVKECELFRLNRKDYQEAIDPYPELSNKIRILALSRLENTKKILGESHELLVQADDFREEDD